MGNCGFFGHYSSPKTVKLIDTQGKLRKINVPVKAVEIMLEEPGHIVCPVDELLKTRRVSAIKADYELLAGNFYVVVPVNRVHTKVNDSEIASVAMACGNNIKKRLSSSSCRRRKQIGSDDTRVLGAVTKQVSDKVEVFEGKENKCSGYSLRNITRKQWSPVLEPIYEF